jgi:WD40 repeat protein
VEIWDVTTGRELATIATSAVPIVRFTPDGGALAVLSARPGGQGAPFVADLDLWDQRTGERLEAVLHWDSSAPDALPTTDAFPDPTLAERYTAYGATNFAFSARGTRLAVVGGAFGAGTQSIHWVATFRAGGL